MSWRSVRLVLLTALGLSILYLLFWPVPIDPEAWTPPKRPELVGVYEPNSALASVERLAAGVGVGSEDVAIDLGGRIYAGYEDGRIVQFQPDGSEPQVMAELEGRPLGMHVDGLGNLLVCVSPGGLFHISPFGQVTVLSRHFGGVPFLLANDVDVGADGTVYFSDSSFAFSVDQTVAELMEHRARGRVLAYDPATGETRMLLHRLHYANGIAVSLGQRFVLVVETGKYQVRRLWLTGNREGETDVLIDNLPGFPDGISTGADGIFWLSLVSPRQAKLEALLPHPFLRKIVMRLPEPLRPAAGNYGFVLGLNAEGEVVHNLQDPAAAFSQISSVQEHDGMLYLGSLVEDAIGRLPRPGSPSPQAPKPLSP
ncbi:MAG: SMP-30/gluconolactonase/LRE family protein [Thermoanaerobaculia bacterium]